MDYEFIDGQKVIEKSKLDAQVDEQTQHLSTTERSENMEQTLEVLQTEFDAQEASTAEVRAERQFQSNLFDLSEEISGDKEAFERLCRRNEVHEKEDMQSLIGELKSVAASPDQNQFYK